jgi:hypothetical protein
VAQTIVAASGSNLQLGAVSLANLKLLEKVDSTLMVADGFSPAL